MFIDKSTKEYRVHIDSYQLWGRFDRHARRQIICMTN